MLVASPSHGHTRGVVSSLVALAVCTHNRTRSVMMAALFQEHATAKGVAATTMSAGTTRGGEPPTDTAVRLLAARNIDVARHQSTAISDSSIAAADIVFAAEQAHVISIAGRWPDAFARTFTLTELVTLGDGVGPIGTRPLTDWLAEINDGRPRGLDYLDAHVGEIDDPTGKAPSVWAASFAQIDDLTNRLAALLT